MIAKHVLVTVCLCGIASGMARAADPDDETGPGRDFPKTLTFDEPGIDDEISLPTIILQPHGPSGQQGSGDEKDVDVELDKRLTTRLSVQVNLGYTNFSGTQESAAGWQNPEVTLKYTLFSDHPQETLVSASLTREFGGVGAAGIGAERLGSTSAAINFGQGFLPLHHLPYLQPFAVTGTAGYLVPDRTGSAAQELLLGASVQYSFDAPQIGQIAPGFKILSGFIPIVELVYTLPVSDGANSDDRRGTVAPGLIFAGEGYQIAAEALIPLTRAAGNRVGFIAQLNIGLSHFGWPALAKPIF